MSHINDNLPVESPQRTIYAGKIATTPTDFSERVDVVIPGLDPNLRWTDCRWQPRNNIDMPNRGNECLVAIDDNNEVWVIQWDPF